MATSFLRNLIKSDGTALTDRQVLKSEINVDTFLSLFRVNDTYSKRILKVLNTEVKEKRDAQEKREKSIAAYRTLQEKKKRQQSSEKYNSQASLTIPVSDDEEK